MVKCEPIIYIVDDDEAIRDSLSLLLESEGLKARAYAGARKFLDGFEAPSLACILLDMRMPGMNGMELLRELSARRIETPVIMMTAYGDVPMAVHAMQEGAVDFIEKPADSQILLKRIRRCLNQQKASGDRTGEYIAEAECLARLSDREREVMELLVQGNMNKQIAAKLDISPRTVEVHRARIKQKLDVKTLPDVVRIALSHEHFF
ncbi:MAG: response regulator [Mariprofundaceae bacterium]|nr:response regulator [Mariprofundaceae bacterium]